MDPPLNNKKTNEMNEKTVFLGALVWLFGMTEAAYTPTHEVVRVEYSTMYRDSSAYAYGMLSDGTYGTISVRECPFGCAIFESGACGTKDECSTNWF